MLPPELSEGMRESAERLGLSVESQPGSVDPLDMLGPMWYQTFDPADDASEHLVHVSMDPGHNVR